MPARTAPADAATLIRNATLLAAGGAGTMAGADVLVRRGTIAALGRGLQAPRGATVVDATGMFVTPGIIDAHPPRAFRPRWTRRTTRHTPTPPDFTRRG